MARSTLELLLDSIKDRDEEPPDRLPVLPQRPTSKGRLPSRKRSSALLLAEPSLEHRDGQDQPLHVSDASNYDSNGHKRPDPHPTLISDGLLPACENGYGKGAVNRDQFLQDNISAKSANSNRENRFSNNGNFIELACLSKKQVPASAYISLKKRRRVHLFHGLQKDSRVWLLNKENNWVLGSIQSASDLESVVCMADDQLLEVPSERLLPANPEFLNEVDDLVQLSFIHEPGVFHVLQRRYERGMYCTRAGSLLIVFTPPKGSPLQRVSHSFKQSPVEALNSMAWASEQPQFQRTVDNAYVCMTKDRKNQSIIIGGECSAGKGESMNAVLKRLASHGMNRDLGNTLLISTLILEAFGNANTANTISASQFGKLVDVIFDEEGNLCGAHARIVFFEKSRVVCRGEAEHSYHIFYQLCEGADASLREKLNLREAKEFNYLNSSACVSGAHPYLDFQTLLSALDAVGITEKNTQDIFSLLGAILWLGNITSAALDSNEAVDNAAKLLKCSKDVLLKVLVNSEDVSSTRDVLACAIYERLVNWLVAHINNALKPKTAKSDYKSITIVDMPSLGLFKRDGLEGLMVNYAQEHLQHFTRWHLLRHDEEVVTCGGLRSHTTSSLSKEETINFLEYELLPFLVNYEGSPLLDQSELGFKRSLESLLAGSSCCKQSLSDNEVLTIYHTFGEVTYSVSRFVKEMKASLYSLTRQMPHLCVTDLLGIPLSIDDEYPRKGPSQEFSCQGPLANVQERVLQMMQQLEDTEPHFIFCMAPSDSQLAQTIEQGYVMRQLHINEVNEVVRLCRSGNYISIPHQLFASRFGLLLGSYIEKVNDPLDISVAVLQRLEVPSHMYQMGWTQIFICYEMIDRLDHARDQFSIKIMKIQKTFRGYRLRKQLERWRMAVTHLQAFVRGWLVRKRMSQLSGRLAEMESPVHGVGMGLASEFGKKDSRLSEDFVEYEGSLKDGDSLVKEKADGALSGCLADVQQEENVRSKRENGLQVKSFYGDLEQKELVTAFSEKMLIHPTDAELALKRKDEEIVVLQQSVKEYERKWLAYEAKMKSMEEMWQKQVSVLEQRLSAATKGSNTEESAYKTGDSDKGFIVSTQPHCASARDTPESAIADPDVALPKNEPDPSRLVLDHLSKELDHRTQVFNDDAKFLVEVKSGQIEANFKPDEELQKLKQRFELWKKDYKGRLKETKGILKKLGKADAAERNRKRWWSKK